MELSTTSIDAQASVAYIQALTTAQAADRAAGNTDASDAVRNNGAEHYIHNNHLDVALNLVLTNYLPRKVLARVKRSMRRDMRKPADMKVRHYYQNLIRMNDEELPNLPPFQQGNKLSQGGRGKLEGRQVLEGRSNVGGIGGPQVLGKEPAG